MRSSSAGTTMPERATAPAKSTTRGRGRKKQVDERARETRAQVDRAAEMDRVYEDNSAYVRPTSLEAPAPRPGMKQRWVDVGIEGKWNDKNWARRQREGWVPRPSDTVPKNFPVPRYAHGRFAGCIGVEGSLLCEMPMERALKRKRYYEAQNQERIKAIDNDIRRVNKGAGGGFGPIKKGEASKLVREKAIDTSGGESDGDAMEL